jgi:hypothetical protein
MLRKRLRYKTKDINLLTLTSPSSLLSFTKAFKDKANSGQKTNLRTKVTPRKLNKFIAIC